MNEHSQAPRLKRLEIQGFKSFAHRTTFELGPGITAVVGPNGSGKSNVADAFRWVLGEQSTRSLRLRRPEDVIFAGGGKRGPAGFAEVSVVLDNPDRKLPLDFTEIVVTRRLHRSGESEYLINRRRVRLRDLVELFLTARLGQNSYAILGQGMVDAVLSLRPEERRGLIEEAAGVRHLRLRIDEATAHLADTRANRDRVALLLGEIAPRLGQLERQAKRAAEHAALAASLAGYLQSLYLRRWRSTIEQTTAVRGSFDLAAAAVDLAGNELAACEEQLELVRRGLAEAQSELEIAEAEGAARREQLRDAEAALTRRHERSSQLAARLAETEVDLAGLISEAAAIDAEAADPDAVVVEIARAAGSAAKLQAALDILEAPLSQAEATLASAEAKQQRLLREASEAGERQLRLVSERRRLDQEALRLLQRRQEALQRLAAWARDFRDAAVEARKLDARLPALEKSRADRTRQAQAAAAARDGAEWRLAERDRTLDDLRRRLGQLEHQRETRRPAEERLVALLDTLRGAGPGRPKLLGVLGGLIQVQQGLEIAVEAALAGALDAVVVRRSAEALQAVQALQAIEAGRLSFYSLDAVRGGHALNLSSENGIVGVASSFVRCDETYRALVEALLGRVIVVESVDVAERIARRGLGTVVTRGGVLVAPGGLVSGGCTRADGYVFRASRELDELRAEIDRVDAERLLAFRELAEARLQSREAGERAKAADGAFSDLAARRAAAEPAIARLRRRLEPLRGALEWTRVAAADPMPTRESLNRDEAQLQQTASRLRTAAEAQAAGALQAARAHLAELVARRTELTSEQADTRSALRALEREREALVSLSESRRAARERTAGLIAARRLSLAELANTATELRAKIISAEALAAERRVSLAAWPGGCEPLRARLQSLRAEEAALVEEAGIRRHRLSIHERAHLDAALALRRAEQEQERAEELLESEAGITPAEAETAPECEAGSLPLDQLERKVRDLRTRIRGIGAVNAEAEDDYRETRERYDFLSGQVADLKQADASLVEAIEELQGIVRERFDAAFASVNAGFERYFRDFFGGGQARLLLTDAAAGGEGGVDIAAQPPGKRLQNLATLSGGERSMTSVALLFALLEHDPAPFCVLDEVDAALDEANVLRVGRSLNELAGFSQFLVITHNRGTVQAANQIYGVSMNDDGVSTVLSLRLDDAAALLE